jgi:murein DD-endopeptidase MepM/ murein hydrolase activator NlpD
MAKRGTPVLSATHGYISAIQWRDKGGNTVSVEGPGGYSHYYAHLDSYGRHGEGQWVEVGDTLGFVGNTGNAQGGPTHLHYGIYTPQGAINPYPLLVAAKSSAAGSTTTTRQSEPATTKPRETLSHPNRDSKVDHNDGGYRSTPRRKKGEVRRVKWEGRK